MRAAARPISELPSLISTTFGLGQDAVFDVSEADPVDFPSTALATLESEVFSVGGCRSHLLVVTKGLGHATAAAAAGTFTNDKAHDFVRSRVIDIVTNSSSVEKGDVLIWVIGEVNNYLVSFAHGQGDEGGVDRGVKEPAIRADDMKR